MGENTWLDRKLQAGVLLRSCRKHLLDRLPWLLFKASMNGLGNWWFHKINVADDHRYKNLLQVLVKLSVAQKRLKNKQNTDKKCQAFPYFIFL